MPLGTTQAATDPRNIGLGASEFCSELGLRKLARPYFCNVGVCQTTIPVVKSIVVTALDSRISVVVPNRAEAEMPWIDARWVVAFVHDDKSTGNLANQILVNEAVRLRSAAISFSSGSNDTIAKGCAVSSPQPTGSRLSYSGFNRNRSKDSLVTAKRSIAPFLCIAKLAKVATKSLGIAQQAFSFTLFHGVPLYSGDAMTLP